jgi:hypothetical protein
MVTGNRLVRLLHPAHKDCQRLLKRDNRNRKIIRRHAMKLRYWPEMHPTDESGLLLDLDWSWVQACKGLRIGELRINESLAGFDNWRVIFFEGPKPEGDEMHRLWILQFMKKKGNDFTDADIKTFKLRRLMVIERYYGGKAA